LSLKTYNDGSELKTIICPSICYPCARNNETGAVSLVADVCRR